MDGQCLFSKLYTVNVESSLSGSSSFFSKRKRSWHGEKDVFVLGPAPCDSLAWTCSQHDAWRSTTPFCRGLGATLSVECGVSYVESNAKLAENSVLLKVQSLEIKGW